MALAQIFKYTLITKPTSKQFLEGFCSEDNCYVYKILKENPNYLVAIACSPKVNDIFLAKVTKSFKKLAVLEVGPIKAFVSRKPNDPPVKEGDVKVIQLNRVIIKSSREQVITDAHIIDSPQHDYIKVPDDHSMFPKTPSMKFFNLLV
ncbi:Hypothetical predicted protein [Paramuricea clavata]|uniref:Uncharacterized protein n=1 Tax=Paramuricea clavata TaxID=317549 RepID=A0A6S7HGP8_PARCT|nr:Hypothetical predicted protein [Paramuricea clavata]